jgi:F0F1-type ATP synthase assembly protein I
VLRKRETAEIPEQSCGMTSDQTPENSPEDTRSSHAKAMDRVAQITTISLCLVLPVLLGYYADQWLGTGFLLTIFGLLFGLVASGVQFRKLLVSLERDTNRARNKTKRPS